MPETILVDKLGRKIAVKAPSTLERINFFRIIGAEDCGNQMVLAELSNAMWLVSIDDKIMPKKQMVDINHIVQELEKGDADELIGKHRIELFKQKQTTEVEETALVKK